MIDDATWDWIFALRAWQPLKALPWPLTPAFAEAYRLAPDVYVYAVPYDPKLNPTTPGDSFATMFFWAPTEGAARRALGREIDADDGTSPCEPPSRLLLGSNGTYSAIARGYERPARRRWRTRHTGSRPMVRSYTR